MARPWPSSTSVIPTVQEIWSYRLKIYSDWKICLFTDVYRLFTDCLRIISQIVLRRLFCGLSCGLFYRLVGFFICSPQIICSAGMYLVMLLAVRLMGRIWESALLSAVSLVPDLWGM